MEGTPTFRHRSTLILCLCLCVVTQSGPTLCSPWTVVFQASLSIKFSRQEFWSELPFPTQGIVQTQGSNSHLLHLLLWQTDSLPLASPEKPLIHWYSQTEFAILFSKLYVCVYIYIIHTHTHIYICICMYVKYPS